MLIVRGVRLRVLDTAGTALPRGVIEAGLRAILADDAAKARAAGAVPHASVASLTAWTRDAWAVVRESPLASGANLLYAQHVDSALFVVVLDGSDIDACGATFLHGCGTRARWFDKHQLIVANRGELAGARRMCDAVSPVVRVSAPLPVCYR